MQESVQDTTLTARTLRWIALTALALLLLWIVGGVLLVIFAGVLVAILLHNLGRYLSKVTPLSPGQGVMVVTVLLIVLIGLTGWLIAPRIAAQVDQLWQLFPKSVDQLRGWLSGYSWSETLFRHLSTKQLLSNSPSLLGRPTGAASTVLSFLGTLVVISFIGLYLAVDSGRYRSGLMRLFSPTYRPRVQEILDETGKTLSWWLIGRGISMAATGILTGVGLWLLGIPLALTLALLAAILTFVPYIGPILSAFPAILLGLIQGPIMAVYVAVFYVVIQFVESYLLTPLVQQETLSLPPAVTIGSLLLFGALFGTLGLMLGTPLAAAAIVLIRMAYVEDVVECGAAA